MNNLIIGRFIPGDSFVHRLDPRSKLLAVFSFLFIVFMANNLWTNLILLGFVLAVMRLTRLSLAFYLKGLKPIIGLLVFTAIFQLFFTQGKIVIWQWSFLRITEESLAMTGIIMVRFILIVFLSTVLTLTTSPLQLADGVESGLKPLEKLGFPAHEVGLMLAMSLRFVPTLMEDATRIMNAQRSRGVEFGEGGFFKRITAVIPILIPLFASSFKRAENLALAMEARGYQGGNHRSKYRLLKWRIADTVVLLVMGILAGVLFFVKSV